MNCVSRIEPRALEAELEIPLRLRGGPNVMEFWATRAKRVKAEREIISSLFPYQLKGKGKCGKWVITLTRISPKKCDDDNLAGMFKAVRDEVAHKLGIDDGSPNIAFIYRQEKASKRYAIRINIKQLLP